MTLRTPGKPVLQRLLCGRSLNVNQPLQTLRPLVLTLSLLATLVMPTLIPTAVASAQESLPQAKPAKVQVAPPARALPRRPNRWSQPAASKEALKAAAPRANVSPTPIPTPIPTPLPTPAPSSEPAPATSPQRADEPLPFMADSETGSREQPASASGLLVRTLGALFLIVGLIVAAAWGMKRFGGARFGTPLENAPPLAVLNSLSLGDRRSLTIVRFGERTLLLGSTAHSVTLLAEAETDDFAPAARSVADILNDQPPAAFSQELLSATEHLDERTQTRRGHHFTA